MKKKNPHAVALGRQGGKATAKSLTPEERAESARRAGLVGGVARARKLTAAQRKAIAEKASEAAREAILKAEGKRQRPGANKNGI
jgi:hypothetical protein